MRARTLTASYLLDWIVGDPEFLPHPVRIIGRAIDAGDRSLRDSNAPPAAQFMAGTLLTASIVGGSTYAASKMLRLLRRISSPVAQAVDIWLAASCLATRNLLDEAGAVINALERSDHETARRLLARIVGRDTADLNPSEVARAVIETLAESLCDGIVAPLMYLVIGGAPLAIGYKAVNTLDSMIGHHSEEYEWFGKAAARLDDVANFIPARIAALLICGSCALLNCGSSKTAWITWRQDRLKHASPNAGQTESAMAGALRVQLGGVNTYAGEMVETSVLGAGLARPVTQDARKALCITVVASVLGFAVGLFILTRRRGA